LLGLENDMDITELAAAAGLLLMTTLLADLLADLLTVGDSGRIQLSLYAEATLELADQYVDLDIAGAGDHHLMGLGVVDHAESGILFVEADEAGAHLLVLTTGL